MGSHFGSMKKWREEEEGEEVKFESKKMRFHGLAICFSLYIHNSRKHTIRERTLKVEHNSTIAFHVSGLVERWAMEAQQ